MAISATGNKRKRGDSGFSLVEVMTALFILGLLAGAAVLLAPGPDFRVRGAAEQVAARVAAASDESVIANRVIAMVVTPEGYGFERLERGAWAPAAGRALSFRAWPDNVDVLVEAHEGAGDESRVVRFDPLGGATPATLRLSAAGVGWRVDVDGEGKTHVSRAD